MPVPILAAMLAVPAAEYILTSTLLPVIGQVYTAYTGAKEAEKQLEEAKKLEASTKKIHDARIKQIEKKQEVQADRIETSKLNADWYREKAEINSAFLAEQTAAKLQIESQKLENYKEKLVADFENQEKLADLKQEQLKEIKAQIESDRFWRELAAENERKALAEYDYQLKLYQESQKAILRAQLAEAKRKQEEEKAAKEAERKEAAKKKEAQIAGGMVHPYPVEAQVQNVYLYGLKNGQIQTMQPHDAIALGLVDEVGVFPGALGKNVASIRLADGRVVYQEIPIGSTRISIYPGYAAIAGLPAKVIPRNETRAYIEQRPAMAGY